MDQSSEEKTWSHFQLVTPYELEVTIDSLRIILADQRLTPKQISSINKVILALSCLPIQQPAIDVSLQLIEKADQLIHYCEINVEGANIREFRQGSYSKGDSYTDLDISCGPDCRVSVSDYMSFISSWNEHIEGISANWNSIEIYDHSDDAAINWDLT